MQYDTLLLDLLPHMHVRGKAFRYTALYPNGTKEILLDVPRYDFNWQNTYELSEPKLLPAGTILEARAVYDNSPENPNNPDPNRMVTFGNQTWNEMMLGFYEACPADQNLKLGGTGDVTRAEAFLWRCPGGRWRSNQPAASRIGPSMLSTRWTSKNSFRQPESLFPRSIDLCFVHRGEENIQVIFAVNSSNVNSRYYMPGMKQSAIGFALAQYIARDVRMS